MIRRLSQDDIDCTKDLVSSNKIVGIEIVDHIIVGSPSRDPGGKCYFSFREHDMI